MGKYDALWRFVREKEEENFKLTYAEMEKAAGVPLDHSFLRYKKELAEYGYEVGKISMKEKTVVFRKLSSAGKKGEKR